MSSRATQGFIGLALPAIRSSGGYFASKDRYDTAWGDLLLAIFCPLRARPMNRQSGSALWRLLFSGAHEGTEAFAEEAIFAAAERECPHIWVRDVSIEIVERGIHIRVSFSLANEDQEIEKMVIIPNSGLQRTLGALQR